jgi:CBS domain containing-hemolysin-like protein
MEPFHYLIAILISTLLSALFTGNEVALISILKLQLEIDLNPDSFISKFKRAVKIAPDKYLATIVAGNSITYIIFVISLSGILLPLMNNQIKSEIIIIILTILVSVAVLFLFGKLIPKILFPVIPAKVLHALPVSLLFFYFLFYPVIRLIKTMEKRAGSQFPDNDKTSELPNFLFNRIDMNWFLKTPNTVGTEKEESVETEVKLFKNALDFSKVKLREIMVPRTEIEMLDVNSSFEELRQKFVETGYSRIIFYENNIDNIVGYIHSSVIFKNPTSLKPFINNVLIVPETMPANKLLKTFIQEHRSIAIVVDEFGGTSGMVTSEDILEEIFGEIEDEHDTSDIIEKKLNDNEYIFSGRSEIDLINEKFGLYLPETEDFETLAGFILFHHESIPTINSIIKIDSFQFKILKATNTRIELVKLTITND